MSILNRLKWRYATKHFDATRKLSQGQLDFILEGARLSPSSYGLQPYKILVVEDADIRVKLKSAAFDQPQLVDASHVILFAIDTDISESKIDTFITSIATQRNISETLLADYKALMKNLILPLSQEQKSIWAAKQAYIALGELLVTCAVEEIDACPMEGFDSNAFDEILNLADKNLSVVVMVTVGFRSDKDQYQHYPKVRKTIKDFVIKY